LHQWNLTSGKFYGGVLAPAWNVIFDGNSKNQGKYIVILPSGKVLDMSGVLFSTNPKNAGEIKEVKK
jgi:hypothetical protein